MLVGGGTDAAADLYVRATGHAGQRRCARLLPSPVGSQRPRRVPQGASLAAPGERRHREVVSSTDELRVHPGRVDGAPCPNPMRLIIACAAALVLSGSAAAALPRQGMLVPGRSLGGVRLGEPATQVRAALGSKFGVCRGCATTTWYFTYRTVRPPRASPSSSPAVASLLSTPSGRPAGWTALHGLKLGAIEAQITGSLERRSRSSCSGYDARVSDDARARTVYYVVGSEALGVRTAAAAREPMPVIGLADVEAAARRLEGVAHRTPVFTSRTLDEFVGARVSPEGGVPPARRRLQVPRRVQQAGVAIPRRARPRRGRVLVRQPRAGGRDRGTAGRHDRDDRDA